MLHGILTCNDTLQALVTHSCRAAAPAMLPSIRVRPSQLLLLAAEALESQHMPAPFMSIQARPPLTCLLTPAGGWLAAATEWCTAGTPSPGRTTVLWCTA